MLGCWWNARVLVECKGACGMLGCLWVPGCWWNAKMLVECHGGILGVLLKCQGGGGMLRCWWSSILGVLVEC